MPMMTSPGMVSSPHSPNPPRPLHSINFTTSAGPTDHAQPPSTAHLPHTSPSSSAKRAATPLEDDAPGSLIQEVEFQSNELSNKRLRLTEFQEDFHLPILSSPSTLVHHSSIQSSPWTLVPTLGSPESDYFPLTSRSLGQHQSQTSSHSLSGLEQPQDTIESESQSSSAEQNIGSNCFVETESDLEEKIGSDSVTNTESDSEGRIHLDWDTDTEGQPLTSKEEKMSVNAIRDLLERNGLLINDPDAAVRGAAVIKKAKDIMDQKRHSRMEDEEAEDVKETMEYYSTVNEKTMLVNLWQLLVNKTRFVKKVRDDGTQVMLTAEEEEAAARWIEKAWRKDSHLVCKYDADFRADTIPEISRSGDPVLDTLLEQVPRVDKPKPDIAMGIDKKAFSRPVLEILEQYARSVTSSQFVTFFATEAKGHDGTIGMATTQCCRVGSAMSKYSLDFWKATDGFLEVEQPAHATAYPKPIKESISFTLALTPELAKMNVHWAEETQPMAQTWHQAELRTYHMKVLDNIRQLRLDLDNIFDWGCGSRMKKITEQAEKVATKRATMNSLQKKARNKAVKELLESPSVKRPRKKQAAVEE
ncbi:MAG: hypothetical protein Q9171_003879 [Xanthocarpia ochracea]